MRKIIFIPVIFFILSCISKKDKDVPVVIENSTDWLNNVDTIELQNIIINSGDKYYYNRLEDAYENIYEDTLDYKLLKYSYIMADQYNYEEANYNIVRDIIRKELKTNQLYLIDSLDHKNKKEVLTRLKKCTQKDNLNKSCLYLLSDYYKYNNRITEFNETERLLDSIMYKK